MRRKKKTPTLHTRDHSFNIQYKYIVHYWAFKSFKIISHWTFKVYQTSVTFLTGQKVIFLTLHCSLHALMVWRLYNVISHTWKIIIISNSINLYDLTFSNNKQNVKEFIGVWTWLVAKSSQMPFGPHGFEHETMQVRIPLNFLTFKIISLILQKWRFTHM